MSAERVFQALEVLAPPAGAVLRQEALPTPAIKPEKPIFPTWPPLGMDYSGELLEIRRDIQAGDEDIIEDGQPTAELRQLTLDLNSPDTGLPSF